MMQENRREKDLDREYYSSLLMGAISAQQLTEEAKREVLEIFEHCSIMGNIQYSQELLELVFHYFRVVQYSPLELIDPFVESLQFRCLLSGDVKVFARSSQDSSPPKLQNHRNLDSSTKHLQQQHEAQFLGLIHQPFQLLQNSHTLYIANTPCKILQLQLDQPTKDTLQTKFDRMRLFFLKYFGNLMRDRGETSRQMQYFRRENRKFREEINVVGKLYFVDEGAVEAVIGENVVPLDMQNGSVVGIEQYGAGEDSRGYVYRVKSSRVTGYSIKISNVPKLGVRWGEFLENSARQQSRVWLEAIESSERKASMSNKMSRVELIKMSYEGRSKAMSDTNGVLKVLDRMHCMEEGVVLNYVRSEKMKMQLPKIDRLNILISRLNEKKSVNKFNPYKALSSHSNNSKQKPERKRLDEYLKIHMKKTVQSLRTSPQRLQNPSRLTRTYTKFQLKPFRNTLLKNLETSKYRAKFL